MDEPDYSFTSPVPISRTMALIPAKANSMRLPDKNIQEIGGISLVGWAILAAKESKKIDYTVVSTDGAWIASEAFKYGADAVIKRPADLALDNTTSEDVVRHALKMFDPYCVVLLQPTSPIRTGMLIDECIAWWEESRHWDGLAYDLVCTSYMDDREKYPDGGGYGPNEPYPEQDGGIYVFSPFVTYGNFFSEIYGHGPRSNALCVRRKPGLSVDINTWEDLVQAQEVYKKSPDEFPSRGKFTGDF